jgi:hypothetical protein
MMLLIAGAAMAQAPVPVTADAAILDQGTTAVGAPGTGDYSILVNGWIEAYARVSAYDNWINFGVMSPTSGTYDAPYARNAYAAGAADLLAGEVGGQAPLYEVNNSTLNYDLAGLQIQTNARLDLLMDFGGYMRRVKDDGTAFAGFDTRRTDGGYYQLRNQAKMVMHGKFLTYVDSADPAQDSDGTAYVSPTSGETTDYNEWTQWGTAANAIPNADGNDGWFEPASLNDPWTGGAAYVTPTDFNNGPNLPNLDLVVERGQAQTSGTGEAAEIWWTQRVLRRGLQDVAGNYRSDMYITLTYREADTQWVPASKP